MARLTKKSINKNENIVHRSSKHGDINHSNSSISSTKLRDNGMLTNKKLFFYYGKQKPDIRLELVLRRLNAEILDSYDEKVNIVITSVSKKIPVSDATKPVSKPLGMNTKGKRLVNLVNKKLMENANQPQKDFLDIAAEKGIKILQLQSVWKWLREYHAPLLQDDDEPVDEENEQRDTKKDLKKLIQPCMKIIDLLHETRPSFYQKCIIQPQYWEETCTQQVGEKVSESAQSKQGDTVKLRQQKSTKTKPPNIKPDAGYCECCRMSYVNLFDHLRSTWHLEYARNTKNYEEIDQTLSNLLDINSFLSVRMRKQTILERKNSNRKLIKTLSANDFKNEHKIAQDNSLVKKTQSLTVEMTPSLFYGNTVEERDVMEMVDSIEEMEECHTNFEECANEYDSQIVVHREYFHASVQEMRDEEGMVGTVYDVGDLGRATVTIQDSELKMADVDWHVSYCMSQMIAIESEHVAVNDVDNDSLMGLNCVSIVISQLHFAVQHAQPATLLDSDTESDESDSSDSENFPKSLTSRKLLSNDNSFRSSFGHEFSPRNSPWSTSSPLDSQSKYNAFSPFFLDNLNNSPNYALLTPNYDFPKVDYADLVGSPPLHFDIDSPTQYVPSGTFQSEDVDEPDAIVDLRRCVTAQNEAQPFDSLSELNLSRRKPFLALDSIVGHIFKRRFQIELPPTSPSRDFLRELTNRKESDRGRKSCAVVQKKSRAAAISTPSPSVAGERYNTRAKYSVSESPDRPDRRAKSVARDSISLTTRLFLN